MGSDHGATESAGQDNPEDQYAGAIPVPRPALDDTIENLPTNQLAEPDWWYYQHGKRGKNRRFTGHVNRIGGAEGQRLRGDLAAIIRNLLTWAEQHAKNPSDEDGGADDPRP